MVLLARAAELFGFNPQTQDLSQGNTQYAFSSQHNAPAPDPAESANSSLQEEVEGHPHLVHVRLIAHVYHPQGALLSIFSLRSLADLVVWRAICLCTRSTPSRPANKEILIVPQNIHPSATPTLQFGVKRAYGEACMVVLHLPFSDPLVGLVYSLAHMNGARGS